MGHVPDKQPKLRRLEQCLQLPDHRHCGPAAEPRRRVEDHLTASRRNTESKPDGADRLQSSRHFVTTWDHVARVTYEDAYPLADASRPSPNLFSLRLSGRLFRPRANHSPGPNVCFGLLYVVIGQTEPLYRSRLKGVGG